MFEKIIATLAGLIIAVISKTGYFGIMLLMGIESACIPLPSEIIMPFAGYLVYSGHTDPVIHLAFNLFFVATAGALGCNLGSVVAYEIGHYGGRPLIERYGSYIFLGRHELDLAERFFKRFGATAVLIGRLLPVVRTFIALPAGVARMPRWRFHVFTFVGSWPWCFVLAWIGMKLGEHWDKDPRLKLWFHRLDAVIILLLAGIILFVWSHWKDRIRATAA